MALDSPLHPEEDYGFETAGFLRVPALSAVELDAFTTAAAAAARGVDGPGLLAELCTTHPILVRYLWELFNPASLNDNQKASDGSNGPPYRLDGPPTVHSSAATHRSDDGGIMAATRGALPSPARGYSIKNGVRLCGAVTAVFALEDSRGGRGWTVLPGSHKCAVAAPRGFRDLSALRWLEQRGVPTEQHLAAGDLLLVVGGAIHGLRPLRAGETAATFVSCSFTAAKWLPPPTAQPAIPLWRRGLGEAVEWAAELSDAERQVLGIVAEGADDDGDRAAADEQEHEDDGMGAEEEELLRVSSIF